MLRRSLHAVKENKVSLSLSPSESMVYRYCEEYPWFVSRKTNNESHEKWNSIQQKIWNFERAILRNTSLIGLATSFIHLESG